MMYFLIFWHRPRDTKELETMPEQSDEVSNVRDCVRDHGRFLGVLSDTQEALTEQPTASSDD